MTPRLKELFFKEIQPTLKTKFGLKNIYMTPKVEKIVINMGLGLDGNDSKILKSCEEDLGKITGQKPVITKFKKSISNFKTRKDANAGVKVTLRSSKMYEFIDRLINIALPRVKDFRGLSSKGIDSSNNFSFGIKEHIIFPEVNFDKVDKIRGLDITIVTSSKNKNSTIELLKEFNFPLIEKKNWGYMAKTSAIQKNLKRIRLHKKYAAKRAELLSVWNDASLPIEKRREARIAISKLPKNSNPNRHRNRCSLTGRSRGYVGFVGLSRIKFREKALQGEFPGIRKASL